MRNVRYMNVKIMPVIVGRLGTASKCSYWTNRKFLADLLCSPHISGTIGDDTKEGGGDMSRFLSLRFLQYPQNI